MNRLRRIVLAASLLLVLFWITANFERLTGDQHGMVRFVLGGLLAAIILIRPKTETTSPPRRPLVLAAIGVLAMGATVGGIVFNVRQFEWLGIILLLYSCWRWALPDSFHRDIIWSLFLLYWLHPLPALFFARVQFLMQQWSVSVAEWMLHAINVRVWADGFFLYSGFNVVGVPESCSGMRTALTVLLCAIGIGVLYRFRFAQLFVLVVVGLGQVILLNAIRIAAVVRYAPQMPREWSENFLHDTLGMFLMVAILLTQLEASMWQWAIWRRKRVAQGIARDELERPQRATRLPRFWHLLFRWGNVLIGLLLLASAIVGIAIKSRPFHREAMRRDVIDGLIETDLEAAERAIAAQVARHPKDRDILAKKARIQVMRRDFDGALATFDLLTPPLSPLEATLKSWSLMAVGRVQDAVDLVDALPEAARALPGVAMVRAEYAAIQGQPQLASRYIVYATGAAIDPNRVRALFPFLARHEQWEAIAKSDSDAPYREPSLALIAAHACLRVNDLDGAARTMRIAIRQWGNDARFLRNLFVLASRRPGSEWEDRFATSFRENIGSLDVEQIVPYIGYCFQLSRPDLAWLAYLRLMRLDPRHPDVFYSPAQYGQRWFGVRRHHIAVGGDDRDATIDLRALAAHTRHLWPLDHLWDQVPLTKELMPQSVGVTRDRYMKWTLAELETRERNGTLSRRGELIFPSVLASEGRFDEAHRRLDVIRQKFPVFAPQVLLQHAEFYDQEKRWGPSYEALREYYQVTDLIELQADLLMVNALLNLNLGLQAQDVANRATRTFPGVSYIDLLRAAIWDIFGFKEQALFTLGQHDDDVFLYTASRLCAETGRWHEADRLYGALGSPLDRKAVAARQTLVPMPAELSVARRWPTAPGPEDTAREIARVEGLSLDDAGPFLQSLSALTLEWLRSPTNAAANDLSRWRATGRDPLEQATALHRVAALLARAGNFELATTATRDALALSPDSAILHRVLVALTEGNIEVVRAARAAVPSDPEIWLAWLVARFRSEGAGPWALEEVRAAIASPLYAPGTLVRAGDFFLRQGMTEPAELLARDAMPRARGLLSAYMLGLRCALSNRDANRALECARLGIEHALDPSVFYRSIVEIKTIQENPDADLLQALEYLKERFPKDAEWAQYLGHVYFQKGDANRALTLLEPLIAQELAGVRVRSLLLAAEAARVSGYEQKAVGILERALVLHPDQISVLNNLIYNLAQRRETAPRAVQLLPRLLDLSDDSFAVLDTAAMVYLRNGQPQLAQQYMDRALAVISDQDYSALETRLNAAEVLLEVGKLDDALARIREVRQDPRLSNFLDVRARQLQDAVERRLATP